ncbi:MAG: hypothetical protein J1E06_06445 [Acutalibacter sp.]|nr:hypothetical protein [Acutalibacter sp.]
MRKCCISLILCIVSFLFLMTAPAASAAEIEELRNDLLEKSGSEEMMDSLEEETRDLLSRLGIEKAGDRPDEKNWLDLLSELLREKLSAPLKALAALLGIAILTKLANCFDSPDIGGVYGFAGTLACAVITVNPLLGLMKTAEKTVESASVFLLASVPAYGGLMAASGSPTAGTSYSVLTLAAGNAIPILAKTLIFPLLHMFLALALTASVSEMKLERFTGSVYNFAKWLLVLAVTVFSGILSIQTTLNAQVDAASNKAAKLIASSAVPIVGGAFGDAVAAIQNSVHIVKSGVGAFGMFAALCIFIPTIMEAAVWIFVCSMGQIAGDLFEQPKVASFLGMCASVGKMILAVLAAICAVLVVSAAIVLFVKGSL